ncbi:MAG TPA: aspartyl/asparaginyl beta-hydroxylase domain-containing protein [Novosphingobium sp.]|nr:aspartyl/asparaginyl beta-hydroxylase domain-containing protein [Novosphingobium sp.]
MVERGLAALRARDHARAAALLREAAAALPDAEMAWVALANAEEGCGNASAAEAALDRRLAQAKRDVGALLFKASLRERSGDERAACSFYRAALNQVAFDGQLPPSLHALHEHAQRYLAATDRKFMSYLLDQLDAAPSPAIVEAVELLAGAREVDLQRPTVFYYPGLPQRRFYERADFAWIEPMLAMLPEMRAELDAMRARGDRFTPYVVATPDRPAPNNPLLNDPAWGTLHFWRSGEVVADHAAACPATMAALEHASMPRISGRSPNAHWSRLLPGTHIAPHHGMLNTRLICHIPVLTAPACTLRVGSETREWRDGEPLIFDDSMEHEARNAGPDERVVLLFEVWRPEIGEADRAALTRIFASINAYE